MSPWKVILAAIIIFVSGVVTGGLLVHNTQSHPRSGAGSASLHTSVAKTHGASAWQLQKLEFLRKMEKQLNLTPEQQQRIEKIMRESQERTKPLWEKIAPDMKAELQRVREGIRAELNPDQRKRFEELLKVRPGQGRKADEPQNEERRRRKEAANTNSAPAN